MGKLISWYRIFAFFIKPLKEFNIEGRAHAAISKEKPTPAPKYKSDELSYEQLLRENPAALEETLKKNEQLDKRLKDVFLTSQDKPEENANPDKSLPQIRMSPDEFETGFYEPEKIPLGRTTLRKAFQFLREHHIDANINNATKIAGDYLLPEKTVEDILKYFKIYEIYMPVERRAKATFAGPRVARKTIVTQEQKLLGSLAKKKKDTSD